MKVQIYLKVCFKIIYIIYIVIQKVCINHIKIIKTINIQLIVEV